MPETAKVVAMTAIDLTVNRGWRCTITEYEPLEYTAWWHMTESAMSDQWLEDGMPNPGAEPLPVMPEPLAVWEIGVYAPKKAGGIQFDVNDWVKMHPERLTARAVEECKAAVNRERRH